MPFAAFFVAVCLLLCIPDRTRKALLCLLLGAAAGWLPRDIPMPSGTNDWKNTPVRR